MQSPAVFVMGFHIKFLLFSRIPNLKAQLCPSTPAPAEVSQDALFWLDLLADRACGSVQVPRAILVPPGCGFPPKAHLPGLDSARATGAKE